MKSTANVSAIGTNPSPMTPIWNARSSLIRPLRIGPDQRAAQCSLCHGPIIRTSGEAADAALSREHPNRERDGQYARNQKCQSHHFSPFPNSQCANFQSAPRRSASSTSGDALTTPAGSGQPRTNLIRDSTVKKCTHRINQGAAHHAALLIGLRTMQFVPRRCGFTVPRVD